MNEVDELFDENTNEDLKQAIRFFYNRGVLIENCMDELKVNKPEAIEIINKEYPIDENTKEFISTKKEEAEIFLSQKEAEISTMH